MRHHQAEERDVAQLTKAARSEAGSGRHFRPTGRSASARIKPPPGCDGRMQILRSKAPLRISFAGGGTDVSPYPEQQGGAVLNCTINKFAYATLEATPGGDGTTSVQSLDYNLTINYEKASDLIYNGELDLVKATLKVFRPPRSNAPGTDSLRLFVHSDVPAGAGLGGSSTMCVALVGAFQRYLREPWTLYEVAELAYQNRARGAGHPRGTPGPVHRRRSGASTISSSSAAAPSSTRSRYLPKCRTNSPTGSFCAILASPTIPTT